LTENVKNRLGGGAAARTPNRETKIVEKRIIGMNAD